MYPVQGFFCRTFSPPVQGLGFRILIVISCPTPVLQLLLETASTQVLGTWTFLEYMDIHIGIGIPLDIMETRVEPCERTAGRVAAFGALVLAN